MHQNERCTSNWPRCFTWLVCQYQEHTRCFRPISISSSCLEAIVIWLGKLTICIFYSGINHFVLFDVSIFDIADRIFDTLNVSSNAFVTFAAQANWPFHSSRRTHCCFKFGVNFAQEICPQKRCTRAVRTVNNSNIFCWQLDAWVNCNDFRSVPLRDFAHVDACEHIASHLHFACSNTVQVDDRNNTTNNCWELCQTFSIELVSLQRHIGRAEIDCFCFDLLDTTTRTD